MPYFVGYCNIILLLNEIDSDIQRSVEEIVYIEKQIPVMKAMSQRDREYADSSAEKLLKCKKEVDKQRHSEDARVCYNFLKESEEELDKMNREIVKIKNNIIILEQSKRVLEKVSLRLNELQDSSSVTI